MIEIGTQFVPLAVGLASAGLTSYYANNFPVSDIDNTHGTISGTAGSSMLGLASASIAIQSLATLEWIKYIIKREEGKMTTHNRNQHYGKSMQVYWWIMLIFYMVAIVAASLNVELVSQYGSMAVEISGNKLQGSFGTATAAMNYVTIGFGGMSLLVYLYAEFFARDLNEPHPITIEKHG